MNSVIHADPESQNLHETVRLKQSRIFSLPARVEKRGPYLWVTSVATGRRRK